MWCWRRLLRVPWTSRRSNKSILKEIGLEYLLERLMLKLKLRYFGHLKQRTNSLEKTLMKIEGRRRRGRQRIRWLDDIQPFHHWLNGLWVGCRSWWLTGRPGVQSMGSQRVRHKLNWSEGQVVWYSHLCKNFLKFLLLWEDNMDCVIGRLRFRSSPWFISSCPVSGKMFRDSIHFFL